ncbi:hypothetical protein BBJ28_00002831 [Nothophytophthora sp. Chile5]|nr:hypothetical protein BBJ28_00002831 [Nothophytophthora sp. Chile5]
MVIRDQVDWRSLQDALALDMRLIESVFYGLSKQYEVRRHHHQQALQVTPSNQDSNNQLDGLLFAKADVLAALETAEGLLTKRPWLRVLHTRLACVSHLKEGVSLAGFVRHRQRDRTVCLRDVRRRLQTIYADAERAVELETQQRRFKAQARAVSPWCVRDSKCLHASPARRLYGVHVLPPRRVTPEQLEAQRQLVTNHARAVVSAAVGLVLAKLLAPYTRPTTAGSGTRTGRRLAHGELDSSRALLNHGRSPSAAARARAKREQEAQLRALRLELLAPTAELGSLSLKTEGKEVETKKKGEARVLLLLATMEAQGDARLARKLLEQTPLQASFRRVAEQTKRLGITDQPWDVVKLWRDLYRPSTLQAIGLS